MIILFNSKNKMFKWIVLLAVLIAIAISVNMIDKSNDENTASSSESNSSDENEQTSFHVGIGHIVMLVILTSAYGIDRAFVYSNKLKEEKQYNNNEEE